VFICSHTHTQQKKRYTQKRNEIHKKKVIFITKEKIYIYSIDVYYLLIVVLKITKKKQNCTTHTGEERIDVFLSFDRLQKKKKSRLKTHITPDVYIQALFFCHEKKKIFFLFFCTHKYTYIHRKTTLHCTALHTYRYIYIYTHKVCHEYLFITFANAKFK